MNTTQHPYHIRYINTCNSEWFSPNDALPETPLPPDLCDVVFCGGIRLDDVYVEQQKSALHIYKNVHVALHTPFPMAVFFPKMKKKHYIGYVGYNQVASVFTSDVVILKKSV